MHMQSAVSFRPNDASKLVKGSLDPNKLIWITLGTTRRNYYGPMGHCNELEVRAVPPGHRWIELF